MSLLDLSNLFPAVEASAHEILVDYLISFGQHGALANVLPNITRVYLLLESASIVAPFEPP